MVRTVTKQQLVSALTVYGIFSCSIFGVASVKAIGQTQPVQQTRVLSAAQAQTIVVTPTPVPFASEIDFTTTDDRVTLRENVHKYICTVFGRAHCDTAFAVSLSESGETVNGERVYRQKAVAFTPKEYSVGIFQINLFNENVKVHWDKIPGNTLEEKQTWLSDPFNNTLIAHLIWEAHGKTFAPWTAYSKGYYLAYMPQNR